MELAVLLGCWERAKDGEGQVVLLSGEPGIGKSRLTRALQDRLGGKTTRLRYQCSPYHVSSALHPVIDQLERAADFERSDTDETRLAKLESVLADTMASVAEAAPLLASLLSLPIAGRYPPLALDPQRRKARTLEVLCEHLAGLAAKGPVLVVLEDAHWIDPSTEELFGLVVERARDLPVLVVVTFRPEFQPPWIGQAHVSLLPLNRLGRGHGGAIVEQVAGKALPSEVLEQIVAKTDGVPLFLEELTKTVLESGLLREEGGRYELAGALPALAIPATLQDSLMARLDRVALVKNVAQIAAALGREFSYELLAAVAPMREEELKDALGQLCTSELVFCRGVPPAAAYNFKHALVQDAAYQSLVRSRRQQLHACIARVLEDRFPEQAEAEPELVAGHCERAGLAEKAVAYRQHAGRRAIERSAMREAATQLTAALEALKGVPEGPERDRKELELQVSLGVALAAARGQPAPETGRAYARARTLAEQFGQIQPLFQALYGQCQHHTSRAEFPASRDAATTLIRLAQGRDNLAAEALGCRIVAPVLLALGEFAAARATLERGARAVRPGRASARCRAVRPGFAGVGARLARVAVAHDDRHRVRPVFARWLPAS